MTELPLGWPEHRGFPPLLRNGEVDGIAWAICPGGVIGMDTINGYARIPWEGHPWTGCSDYGELEVAVHGGLTFGPMPSYDLVEMARAVRELAAERGRDLPFPLEDGVGLPPTPAVSFADVGGWIGFDTGHAWDAWSTEELARWGIEREEIGINVPVWVDQHTIWWTGEMVIEEAKSLAAQIARAGRKHVSLRKADQGGVNGIRHDRGVRGDAAPAARPRRRP